MANIKVLPFLITFLISINLSAKTYKVADQESYYRLLPLLQAGDTLLLANGTWIDFNIIFKGNGTAEEPITLCAETAGKVILSGKSNLKLAGSYLVVSKLLFKNGSSPDDAVISFKISEKEFAINSRVTESVIDHFNKPTRYNEDNYVALWGRNNRVDHCYFAGKTNIGVTLEVYLFGKEHQENHHRIDHNYFGPRPRLGSNGGETMRVGSSEVSKQPSFTLIESNYFEKCNGETEVISIKACDNIIRSNTLFECEGGLVLRHGDRNTVANNFFIGNGKTETAGVRVINDGHKIYNNYFYGLRGKDFRGPLVLMDGVPNSPLIRYHQVDHVEIVGNVWINCEMPWHFGYPFRFRGNEKERVPPVNTVLAWNVVYNDEKTPLITTYDEIAGIKFKNNYTNLLPDSLTKERCITSPMSLKQHNGNMMPTGFTMDIASMLNEFPYAKNEISNFLPVFSVNDRGSKNSTGPNSYNYKEQKKNTFQVIEVRPGKNTLNDVVTKSTDGDVIVLSEGIYTIDREVNLTHNLTFKAKHDLKNQPIIQPDKAFTGEALLRIKQGGAIKIQGLSLKNSQESAALFAIASDRNNMSQSYTIFVDRSLFDGFNSSQSAVIKGCKGTFADTVLIRNSTIRNSFAGLSYNEEIEDKGIYNAEYVILENTAFDQIRKNAIDLYRGGTDESTFGPFLQIDHCVFNAIGTDTSNSILNLTGVQHVDITNSIFSNSPKARTVLLDGKYNTISNSNVYQSGKIESINGAWMDTKTMYSLKPDFANDGSFLLNKNSALLKMGKVGPIGLYSQTH